MYSRSITQLIRSFKKLPSVGERTAERFVFYLLKSGKKDVRELIDALQYLIQSVKSCEICWDFSDQSPCSICRDTTRDNTLICVVAEPQDLHTIEKMNVFRGVYHVLRGTLNTHDEEKNTLLKISELLERIEKKVPQEIILACNSDLPGETTMLYLQKKIKQVAPSLSTTRLARGLPMGSDLQYADDITLGSALKHRTKT